MPSPQAVPSPFFVFALSVIVRSFPYLTQFGNPLLRSLHVPAHFGPWHRASMALTSPAVLRCLYHPDSIRASALRTLERHGKDLRSWSGPLGILSVFILAVAPHLRDPPQVFSYPSVEKVDLRTPPFLIGRMSRPQLLGNSPSKKKPTSIYFFPPPRRRLDKFPLPSVLGGGPIPSTSWKETPPPNPPRLFGVGRFATPADPLFHGFFPSPVQIFLFTKSSLPLAPRCKREGGERRILPLTASFHLALPRICFVPFFEKRKFLKRKAASFPLLSGSVRLRSLLGR